MAHDMEPVTGVGLQEREQVQAWNAMLEAIEATGAMVIAAQDRGALAYSTIVVDTRHCDLAKVENAMFANLLFHPFSLEERSDLYIISGVQRASPRPVEKWSRTPSDWDKGHPHSLYHLPTEFRLGH